MKKQTLIFCAAFFLIAAIGSVVFGQDKKTNETKPADQAMMTQMMNSPHHRMAMAYRQNILNFALALREMTAGQQAFDRDFAREALAEIKRSAEMTDKIHQKHQASMNEEMRLKTAAMAEKMSQNQMALKENIAALETLLQSDQPVLKDVHARAASIVSQFEKMKMSGDKMAM